MTGGVTPRLPQPPSAVSFPPTPTPNTHTQAAFWDNFASYLELPVSTTHTTVGAIIGMALVIGGGDAVVWSASSTTFPYFKVPRV